MQLKDFPTKYKIAIMFIRKFILKVTGCGRIETNHEKITRKRET